MEKRKELFEEIYYGDLGMCGCGSPEEVKNFLYNLLLNHKQYMENIIDFDEIDKRRKEIITGVDSDIIFEIVFHCFEHSELLNHGSSVYSSWFTVKGNDFTSLLKEFKDE